MGGSANDKRKGVNTTGVDHRHRPWQRRGVAALPECAAQQVCSALYVRVNRTQPLCACPAAFAEPCSDSAELDEHTIKLVSNDRQGTFNLIKVCEPVLSVRRCQEPRDWQLLALQSTRTGRAHYLLVCRCPTGSRLLGPVRHTTPPYANIPGIRVYGMLCAQGPASLPPRDSRNFQKGDYPEAPWPKILEMIKKSGLYYKL
ncbi:uncharacterized protein LOC142812062 isoform X2 [Rhipicephalus microplus]|uniref:uncharacterized protein LOC142812062 isoform X2 n=1 Tax=Rhipicephalus microplus TaxID=6941 RepID=UPI001887101A|nr:uncharacterized protein LOC119159532 isoform X2 [Rhipicephalus microplus]XP_037268225.1 uncharacterized protein LOC119159532 isoform X2 [Rhipicephalus microplus]